ncbi:hypothetical protein ACT2CV_01310 [Pasteurellaceae bacterium 22721_9_1]
MSLWQRIKNAIEVADFKHTSPFTNATLKREVRNTAASNSKTVGAIHRFDVAAGGFFKRRTLLKDKLFRCSISRYFILKFGAFCFCVGQFFLSRFVGVSEYFDLILEQSNPLTQNGVTFDAREQIKSGFSRGEDCGNVHNEPIDINKSSDFKQVRKFKQ